MANSLDIPVTADTKDAQSQLDQLGHSLDQLDKTAAKTGKDGAKAADAWGDALEGVGDAMPDASDAAGMEQITKETRKAANEAEKTKGAFANMGERIKGAIGGIGTGIREIFGEIGGRFGELGRKVGTAFGNAFTKGMMATVAGALILLGAALVNGLVRLNRMAGEQGKQFMEAYTAAFAAGVDLSAFDEMRAAFSEIVKPEQLDEAAASLAALGEAVSKGAEEGRQAQAAFEAMGGNLDTLIKGGKDAAAELEKIAPAFRQLTTMQQRDLLQLLFPAGSEEMMAQVQRALTDTGDALARNTAEVDAFAAAQAEARAKQEAYLQATNDVSVALDNLWSALGDITGVGDWWANLTAPETLQRTADDINNFAEVLRNLPGQIEQAFTDVNTFLAEWANSVLQTITDAFNKLAQVSAAGAQKVVDGIKAAFTGLADWIGNIFNSIWQKAQSIWGKISGIFKNMPGLGGGGAAPQLQAPQLFRYRGIQAAYAPQNGGSGYSTLSDQMSRQSNLLGRRPLGAANDTGFGGGIVGQMNQILYNFDEYEKAVTSAAAVTETAGAVITQSFTDAALATGELGKEASTAETELSGIDKVAADLESGFQSWGDSLASSLSNAIINGEDLSGVLAGLAKQLADMILQLLVFKPLMGALGGGGGGLFSAVPMSATSASTGPQTFAGLQGVGANELSGLANIQGRSRLAQDSGRGDTTVNNNVGDIAVDMSGTGLVAATSDDGKKLGQQIQRAVEAILVKESRPGGILRQRAA